MWRELLRLIEDRRYFPPEQQKDQGYRSYNVDVRLLDALDLLNALDDEACRLVPDYERIFKRTYFGEKCACPPCQGCYGTWQWLINCADEYHRPSLSDEMSTRIFGELVLAPGQVPWN